MCQVLQLCNIYYKYWLRAVIYSHVERWSNHFAALAEPVCKYAHIGFIGWWQMQFQRLRFGGSLADIVRFTNLLTYLLICQEGGITGILYPV